MGDKLDVWNQKIEIAEDKKNYKDFFSPIEQLLYVSAFKFNKLKLDDSLDFIKYLKDKLDKIRKFIEDNKNKYFIDVNKIQNNILNFTSNNVIDCTISHFISKCHINNILINNNLLKEYIKEFRKIISLEEQEKFLLNS